MRTSLPNPQSQLGPGPVELFEPRDQVADLGVFTARTSAITSEARWLSRWGGTNP